jgi:hypothetical protein
MIREQFGKLYFLRESHKRSQLFIRVHNETLSIVTVCINNPDRLPVGINR